MSASPSAPTTAPITEPGIDWASVRIPGIDASTVSIVLGGAGAIGLEVVRAFAALGATVALVSRSADRSAALAADVTGAGRVLPAAADMQDSASISRMVAEVVDRAGAPGVLVNSAAIGASRRDPTEVGREQISAILDVNVVGAFEAAKAVAGPMRARGGGRIVNIASVAAQRALPGSAPYAASKAALITLSRNLAVDLGPDGITVNSVSPGQTPTALRNWDEPAGAPQAEAAAGGTDGIPLGRRGRLADYVGAVLFLCSSLADYVTGVDIPVEGGGRLVRARTY
jgi:NAD(P)-dependent dehydrogenase (short-subunit alcohol dehydrogenase family)